MKLRILTLALTVIYLSSCQKDSVTPTVANTTGNTKTTTPTGTTGTTLNQITVVDTTKGYLRIQMAQDAVNTDNIIIHFNPTAKTGYVANEDAKTLQGFGSVSLSSLSSDNVPLAINVLPLSKPVQTIDLAVNATADGAYKLNLTKIQSIPGVFDIWLKDNFKKDSVNFRSVTSYAFSIKASDATTYGNGRFSVVLRAK